MLDSILDYIRELRTIDVVSGAMLVAIGLLLTVTYMPISIRIRRLAVMVALVGAACLGRLMIMSQQKQELTLQSFLPFIPYF